MKYLKIHYLIYYILVFIWTFIELIFVIIFTIINFIWEFKWVNFWRDTHYNTNCYRSYVYSDTNIWHTIKRRCKYPLGYGINWEVDKVIKGKLIKKYPRIW